VLSYFAHWVPVFIALFFPAALIALALYLCWRKAEPSGEEMGLTWVGRFLLVDPETVTYSLSRFQLISWTMACITAYVYLATAQILVQNHWQLPAVPDGLPALLGLSAGATAISVFTTGVKGSKGAGAVHPAFCDFFTTGSVFAPERFQFFLWTILGVVGFVVTTLLQDPSSVQELPKVPDNFVTLMGASSFGYLAGKVTRKAGPVIKELDPKPPYDPAAGGIPRSIRIVGQNLSPRAQVKLNGTLLPSDCVRAAEGPEGAEFVGELILTPPTGLTAPVRGAALAVINPDGQIAEAASPAPTSEASK
jgi:hypothetical protein